MFEESLNYFNQALEIDSSSSDFWHFKALCLQRLGNYDESIKSFEKALKLNPEDATIKK